jgi:hypothetical protein
MDSTLQDRREDLDEATPGNVRATVESLLGEALEHLYDAGEGGVYSVQRAANAVHTAIEILSAYEVRLRHLDEDAVERDRWRAAS